MLTEDVMSKSRTVRARGLTRCFGDVVALDGVDLDVVAGQIHGIVGPNGAGKTTLLGILLGLAAADSGTLEVLGVPVRRALAAPGGVAGFVDGPGLYPALTARGNLAALTALRGPGARTAGIESAMLGTTSSGTVRTGRTSGSAVRGLVPPLLRGIARPTRFGAIVARESRFWWRDPRRRASLVSILIASAVIPIALNVVSGPVVATAAAPLPFSFAVAMSGTMGGMMLANQFAFDGNAYAAHLLSQVPGWVELRARAVAVALVALPVQVLVVVSVSVLTGRVAQVPAGFGLLCAAFGAAIAAAALVSVLAPYALPDNSNPFALNSGGGSAKGMLALVAMIATLVITLPVIIAAHWLATTIIGAWAVLAFGAVYGLAVAVFGTYAAGELLDRRGPEVLVAVTPRR